MSIKLNGPGDSHARELIAAGKVDDGPWSFDGEDGNKLLGPQGNHWSEYGRYFLAIDTDAADQTKERYKYPYGKDGKAYRRALNAIRSRASQQGASAIYEAAGKLLDLIDPDQDGDDDTNAKGDTDNDMSKGARSMPAGPERRMCPAGLAIETRSDGQAQRRAVVGHASVFDQWTTLYDGQYYAMRERVRPGAFDRALRERQDVRALFNHDPNVILGRTKSGTLRLSVDSTGLRSEIDPPDTQTVNDLVMSPIARGDMDGMSFGFIVRRSPKTVVTQDGNTTVIDRGGDRITLRMEGDREIEERDILDVDLLDVSPVVYPAYDGTDVALRGAPADADFLARCRERDRPREVRTNPRGAAVRSRLLKTLAAE